MKRPPKLGCLVTGEPAVTAARPRRPVWLWLILAGAAATLVTCGCVSGWLPAQFVPRQLIIRGCCLSNVEAIAAALQASGSENYWQLWREAQAAAPDELPWVEHISTRPLLSRTLLVTVNERLPLLAVSAGSQNYWLCDDGRLVAAQQSYVASDVLPGITTRPRIRLADDPGEGPLESANLLLGIAARCESALPGKISRIELSRLGEVTLYDRGGLEIRLGNADFGTKIAALPKALRICEANRTSLRYLDATDARVFYQKWNHTISSKTASAGNTCIKPDA